MPSIGVYSSSSEKEKDEKDEKDLYFEKFKLYGDVINIGLGTAVNIEFYDIYIENKPLDYSYGNASNHAIAVGDKIDFVFNFNGLVIENKFLSDKCKKMIGRNGFTQLFMVFSMRFEDLLGNNYVQQVRVHIVVLKMGTPNNAILEKITSPVLQIS
ncbi:hypothetical protein [Priestia megaterium]|uniref:hypothetical protein n=1 Tax=Priestia megaterium TaxID=1404 RepID=UPI0012B9B095|nr:hypothetical protein [Priestia megaterium]